MVELYVTIESTCIAVISDDPLNCSGASHLRSRISIPPCAGEGGLVPQLVQIMKEETNRESFLRLGPHTPQTIQWYAVSKGTWISVLW